MSFGPLFYRVMRSVSALAIVLACALAALVAAAPLHAQDSAPAPATTAAHGSAVLRPGDVLRLRIWREPDLSGEFSVDQHGTVVFPKLGARRVTDLTTDSLQAALVRDYSVYLRNPSIEITVMRRVNVLGAVKLPGVYPVDPTMTLGDVLALAGGVTPVGKGNRVELHRDGERVSESLSDRVVIADTPIRSGDQIFVPERSWLSRNPTVIAASIGALASFVIALTR